MRTQERVGRSLEQQGEGFAHQNTMQLNGEARAMPLLFLPSFQSSFIVSQSSSSSSKSATRDELRGRNVFLTSLSLPFEIHEAAVQKDEKAKETMAKGAREARGEISES